VPELNCCALDSFRLFTVSSPQIEEDPDRYNLISKPVVPSITPSAGQSIHSSRVMFAWPPYEHYLYAELTEGRRLGVLWRSSRLLAFAILTARD
jgi:hypothetical protein